MKYYFCGHVGFHNRGCEALIRSIVKLVREQDPSAVFLCPSTNQQLDFAQWQSAGENGVRFVAAPRFPEALRWWDRLDRRLPHVTKFISPPTTIDMATRAAIEEADAMLMTGGDNISLDYGRAELFFWCSIAEHALSVGKPVHMWANSVGPFSSDPGVESWIKSHLAGYTTITARETETRAYLAELGFADVPVVADPAFALDPEPTSAIGQAEARGCRILGLNVSPLIRARRGARASRRRFDQEIAAFISDLASQGRYHVLLVSHVHPPGGSGRNSDHNYLQELLELSGASSGVTLLPPHLNAAQIKNAIGACHFFMGARTHATIAALSSCVPTISIAYSRKATGLNRDLFGHLDYVLPASDVSSQSLRKALGTLEASEEWIRRTLAERIPVWQERARIAARMVSAGQAEERQHMSAL